MRKPILALTLAFLALLAPAAHAAHDQYMTFEAPRDLLDPATRPAAMDKIAALGVNRLRVILTWRTVAPSPTSRTKPDVDLTDPASYSWGEYDALLTAAAQRGWKVLLTVSGPVPKWATKKRKEKMPKLIDSNRYDIFVAGLSNGWSLTDPIPPSTKSVVRRKTLQLKFQRLGDKYLLKSEAIRFDPPARWLYRASQLDLSLGGKDKEKPKE